MTPLRIPQHLQSGALYNDDLAPVPWDQRTWGAWNIAALWTGMVVCIPTYMLAASMIDKGMSWKQAIFTVFLGNLIVLLPMLLNGAAGTTYGVSFPVLVRAPFGTSGTHVPSLMRALVGCGWFGIQTAIGGSAIYELTNVIAPGALQRIPDIMPAWFGMNTGQAICFAIFWLINFYFIWEGTESIKWLESLGAPALLALGLLLLGWAIKVGGGLNQILVQPSTGATPADFWKVFWPSLTAMVGFWATLSLNIPDFTRYATSQRAQVVGQAIGLPIPMALFAFIGVAVTGATLVVYREPIWDPVQLAGRFQNRTMVAVSLMAVLVATLTTNIAANVMAPANAIANLAPRWISLRLGGIISAIIGTAIMPWKLLADPTQYIFTWLIGYSALLGPIAGIMIADYFIVHRQRLDLPALFDEQGIYGRWNWRTLAILLIAILPNLPGFLQAVGLIPSERLSPFWLQLYPYAWFVGFGVAGLLQAVFGRRIGPAVDR
jgi:NCS1 family nucleobase:cation symporter-1